MKKGMKLAWGAVHLADDGAISVSNGSLARTTPDLIPVLQSLAPPTQKPPSAAEQPGE